VHLKVNLTDILVCRRDIDHAKQPQLFRQAALQGAERAFAATARLRRIGRNMLGNFWMAKARQALQLNRYIEDATAILGFWFATDLFLRGLRWSTN
jgi:hypothetical protein